MRMAQRSGWLLALAGLAMAATAMAGPPPVRLPEGRVAGAQRDGVAFFGNIPFAAAPTGANRWRAPQPVTPWRSVRDASSPGPDCPQPRRAGTDDAPQSEDCLTLNIATPNAQRGGKLPVLVIIHGGAYFVGSGREPFDQGMPPMVRQGVVLVAPNYRLGRLGFFAHPALSAEAPKATANYWLMDQVAALRWVHAHIDRFGGDPANVTIIGCSAGGSSINALMATPPARGLFARASAHSAGGLFNANRPLEQAQAQGVAFATRVGVTGADALAQLRALSVAQLLAGDSGAPDFGAVVDGHWLPRPLSTLFASGAIARVPILSGSTDNEASIFGLMGFDRAGMTRRFGIDFEAAAPLYGARDDAELLRQVQTDFLFTTAALGMTQLAAKAGNPAWSYHFAHVPPDQRAVKAGADHCADRPYWMGQPPAADTQSVALAHMMTGWLLNYVRQGNPNGPGLLPWPASQPGRANPLLLGDAIRPAPDFRAAQLAPWYARWERDSGQRFGWTP
jgi:para-nitrobenzyl esterase